MLGSASCSGVCLLMGSSPSMVTLSVTTTVAVFSQGSVCRDSTSTWASKLLIV